MASGSDIRAGGAFVEAYLKDDKLYQGLERSQRRLQAWGRSATDMGKRLLAVTAVAAAPLAWSIKQASAMEETMNKFNVVFGGNAAVVKGWSDDFGASMGRSKEQVASFMAGSQDLFVPLGFAADAATDMSKQVTQLAVDLASFNNKADADVLRDLHAALTGSGEVMKKYGVIVSEAAVKQELLNQGMDPKVATDQEKVQARLNIILAGTTAAQGDAARSAGSFANQMKALYANVSDAAVEIGNVLLPAVTAIVTDLAGTAKTVAQWARENKELIVTLGKILALLAALAVGLIALGGVAKGIAAVTAAAKGLYAAFVLLTAHPLVLTFTLAAGAVIALGMAFSTAAKSTREYLDETDALIVKQDARRAEMDKQFGRLEQLAEKERLNNQEMSEAERIIQSLEGRYGSLGVVLDETTGRIQGVTEAWGLARAAQDRIEIRQITQQMDDLGQKAIKVGEKIRWGFSFTPKGLAASMAGGMAAKQKELHDLTEQRAALELRRRALQEGLPVPAWKGAPGAGPAPGAAGTPGAGKDDPEKRLKDSLRFSAELFHRQQAIRLGMIEDEHKREIELINDKYDHEIKMAKLAGNTIAGIEQTRQLELTAARQRQAEAVADREAALRDEIARAEIEGSGMSAAKKRQALLSLDRRRELAEADRLGVDPELVMRKYDLLRMGAERQQGLAQAKASVTGGFSAYGVARGVGGYDIQTRIARSSERTADGVQQLLTEAKNSQLVFK
ncbi:MAG TPA: hypothetical protein VMY35_17335 [Phycisphaerae bacterium]|nr:hypothetical protein [Thermoguttaceae bacterium]HUX02728.1 hypothetical protein [Phycisphaerae bacterium]